ncbi:hypothetical protein DPMN_102484 [Dreissena polymorpha]|nr:hypothetical protein DPMN_102484 [Dreissena polymorpha]
MACEYPCVYCARNVGEEDKAISRDDCERWQHLSCETGVSLRQYRKMMKGNVVVTSLFRRLTSHSSATISWLTYTICMFFSGVAGATACLSKGHSERVCLPLESARVPEGCE